MDQESRAVKKPVCLGFIFLFLLVLPGGLYRAVYAAEIAQVESLSHDLDPREIISIQELRDLINQKASILILDARGKTAYDQGHIQGAVLPMPSMYYQEKKLLLEGLISKPFNIDESLSEMMKPYPKDMRIVTYCNSHCGASASLLKRLQGLGFTRVQSMEDGYQAWEKAGHPVVIGSPRLSSEAVRESAQDR